MNTGTFGDEENDPVTLSASEGSVTQTGAGSFLWNEATPSGPDRLVFITATEPNGQRAVIPFRMDIAPVSPAGPTVTTPTKKKCKKKKKHGKKKKRCKKKKKKKK